MIVSCPTCATRFGVDAAALGPSGRKVRCARCFAVWHQAPEAGTVFAPIMPEAPPPAYAAPEPLPNFMVENSVVAAVEERAEIDDFVFIRRPTPPKPVKTRNLGAIAALGSSVVAIMIIGAVVVLGRGNIVARWPILNAAYAAVGLQAEPIGTGLELRGINSAMVPAGGKVSLVVAGEVANISSIPRSVPPLTIHLRDGTNKVIASWKIFPAPGKLPPGETMPFQTSMASPPAAASSAVVTFQP